MSYTVGRIPGGLWVDPDAGGHERQRKREKPEQKAAGKDSVTISDEARTRSVTAEDGQEPD